MYELIFIRHGEAAGQGCYLGRRSNPRLTDTGRAQVSSLKSCLELSGLSISKGLFFSSPMYRAVETTGILTEYAPEIIDEFAEMDFGEWDGLGWSEISGRDAAGYKKWTEDPVTISPPGGETLQEFNNRVEHGLGRVLHSSGNPDDVPPLFIVAHGGVIRTAICSLLGLGPGYHWSFNVGCASYSRIRVFDYDKNSRVAELVCLNVK